MTTTNTHENFDSAASGFVTPTAGADISPQDSPSAGLPEGDPDSDTESQIAEMSYTERLEKLGISTDEATKIIDDMCDNGSFIEKIVVRKERGGRKEVKAAFVTRDTRTQGYITEYVSKHHQDLPVIYNKLMGELQLAGSLAYYNDTMYPLLSDIEDDNEFQKELFNRVKLLSKLPAPVTVKLSRELGKFDLTIAAVMAPGYEDFF